MSHYTAHARSSANKFGGVPEDYYAIHRWMDESKSRFPGPLHRIYRHHTDAVWEATQLFGDEILLQDGRTAPTTYVLEQHLLEDLGWLPSLSDWLKELNACILESRPLSVRFRSSGHNDESGIPTERQQKSGRMESGRVESVDWTIKALSDAISEAPDAEPDTKTHQKTES